MKRCEYCGKEYTDSASVCEVDGQPLQGVIPSSQEVFCPSKPFFRWKPVSISLIALVVLYWAVALLNFWLVYMLEQRGDTRNVSFLLWGSFWNLIVGTLCLSARQLLKSTVVHRNMIAIVIIGVALLIVMRTWLGGLFTGRNPFPVVEALCIWPWFAYAMMYAVGEIEKQKRAEAAIPH